MKGNDTEPSLRPEQIDHLIQTILKHLQFSVQFNADRLKCALCRMPSAHLHFLRNCSPDNRHKLPGCQNGLFLPLPHNMFCDIFRKFILPVIADNTVQLRFAVAVDNIRRGHCLSVVHAHIERRGLLPVSEPPLRVIQLIGRHAQIQKDPVHLCNTDRGKFLLHGGIVAPDDRHPVGKSGQTFTRGFYGIRILIHADQPPFSRKALRHPARVSPASERPVHIDSVRTDIQVLCRLLQ